MTLVCRSGHLVKTFLMGGQQYLVRSAFDRSNHGGFTPEGTGYSCFRCGKHSIRKILGHFVQSQKEVSRLLNEYGDILKYHTETHKERASKVEWPPPSSRTPWPSVHAEYLHKRGYNPKLIRGLYGVTAVYYNSPFKYRVVIPVYQNRKIVTYVGRDITGKSPLRYKNLSERKSVLPAKECVYNLDSVYKRAIITEGVFGSWRFGVHGVALFGIQYTAAQTNALAKRLEQAFVLFDNEPQAQQKAHELCETLAMQGVSVENIELTGYDEPDEIPQREADQLKLELFNETNYT